MTHNGCPTDADLAAFNLGELSEAALDRVAAHVEACYRCEGRLQALDGASDGVITSLRGLSAVAGPATPERAEALTLPAQVGEYEILEELGRGGLGVVFRARHRQLGREAALKMLLGGEFAGNDYRQRFQAEARAVARLRHPNIVQLFDAGEHQGQPYFAMELVDGGSLSARLRGQPQPPEQAARWAAALARAVHYAHEQKLVHRDLKPSNVLVAADGRLKICDFGVAKHLEAADTKTQSGQLVGTPEYMAPEQAAGRAQAVGPAADIYSLGAILYALLTGRPPFQGAAVLDTLEQVRTRDPLPPSRLQPGVPRDLATICLKCLEKEPHRRYATAAALADDLDRFLDGKPILARPAGTLERGWKWARRRPAVAALAAAVVGTAALGFVLVFWQWQRAETKAIAERAANERAQSERRAAVREQADLAFQQGLTLCEQGETGRGLLWLVRSLEKATEADAPALERAIRINLADWRGQLCRLAAAVKQPRSSTPAPWWPLGAGDPAAGATTPVLHLAFPPDPKAGTFVSAGKDRHLHFWDLGGATAAPPLALPPKLLRVPWVTRIAFHPGDSNQLAAGDTEGQVIFWDVRGRRQEGPPLAHAPQRAVWGLAFSPDGRRLVTMCDDGAARWWDVATRQPVGEPLWHAKTDGFRTLALSPDGETLVTGGVDGLVVRWDARDAAAARRVEPPLRHESPVSALAFLPDGRRVVTATDGGRLRFWDLETGQAAELPRQGENVPSLAVSADGRTLATGAGSGVIRFWDTTTFRPLGQTLKRGGSVNSLVFHPSGRSLLAGFDSGAVELWELPQPRSLGPALAMNSPVHYVAFGGDAPRLLAGSRSGAQWWDVVRSEPCGPRMHNERYEVPARVPSVDRVRTYAPLTDNVATVLAPNGRAVAVARRAHAEGDEHAQYELWDAVTGDRVQQSARLRHKALGAAFSPDARRLLTWGDGAGSTLLWNAAALREPRLLRNLERVGVRRASFRPDGTTVLVGCRDGRARLWDLRDDAELPGEGRPHHAFPISAAELAPRGARVVTGCHAGTVRLWDLDEGRLEHDIRGNAGEITAAVFSPDGAVLLTASQDGAARYWDVASGRQLGPALQHPDAVLTAAFAADGRTIATGAKDGHVQRWRVPAAPEPGDVARLRLNVEAETGLQLDDKGAVFTLPPEAVAERRRQLATAGR